MRLTTTQKIRDADAAAIHVRGIPSILLMRNAAGHLARAAEARATNRRAVVFCGVGNNGGDGIGAALRLMRRGFAVRVFLVGQREKMTPDTREMERRLTELGGTPDLFDPAEPGLAARLAEAGVILDAIFGVGLRRPLEGQALAAVRAINAAGVPVVSADIPSGVEADTGRILGEAVRAAETVTFTRAKPGHFVEPGCTCCGRLTVADIGIPQELALAAETAWQALGKGELRLPRRSPVSHKGDYGRLLILGGSRGLAGAPNLCAQAALRAGAGLVSLGVPEAIYTISALKQAEAMVFPLPGDGEGQLGTESIPALERHLAACDVCVCGPGLGRGPGVTALVRHILHSHRGSLVLDADALWAVAQDPAMLRDRACRLVLTPHDGEYARLGGTDVGGRLAGSLEFAREYGILLVRKGHRTIVAWPEGDAAVICAGNPGMAKGGTGDALAGVLGGLLCQLPAEQAVPAAVWLHARAGDLACARLGEYAMTASDLIASLGEAELEMMEEA